MIKAKIKHQSGFVFEGEARGHKHYFDTKMPGTQNKGPTPKEYLVSSIIACSGMDVVGLLRKNKIEITSLEISGEAEEVSDHPKVFSSVQISYFVYGENLDQNKIKEIVELSMNKYCGISAMISKNCPVHYKIIINDTLYCEGQAHS